MSTRHYRRVGIILAMIALFSLGIVSSFAAEHESQSAKTKFKELNLNTATVEELSAIKGLGTEKAKAIVEFREKNGPFSKVDDLLQVKGIDEKTLGEIRSMVKVEPAKSMPPGEQPQPMQPMEHEGPMHEGPMQEQERPMAPTPRY